MKIIVTHMSPDLDAIASVWVVKKFLPGWQDAQVQFVPAGQRLEKVKHHPDFETEAILKHNSDEIMHVDTGLGPLDHHQTADQNVCGASRSWDFVQRNLEQLSQPLKEEKKGATDKIIKVVVAYDHFQEVYWPEADADYHEFSLFGIMEGLQYTKQGEDAYFVEFGRQCFDYLLAYFENKIWAESGLVDAIPFTLKFGNAIGVESPTESVTKLAQKKGSVLVVRKDPRRGHVSIKTLPNKVAKDESSTSIKSSTGTTGINNKADDVSARDTRGTLATRGTQLRGGIDLTLAYEQLKKVDPDATWYLHVSKKMLLNGSTKNPDMKPTSLSLEDIIKILESLYG